MNLTYLTDQHPVIRTDAVLSNPALGALLSATNHQACAAHVESGVH